MSRVKQPDARILTMTKHKLNIQFAALFENANVGVVVVNARGEIVAINKHALSTFGYQENELLSQPVEQLMPAAFKEKHVQKRKHYMSQPQHVTVPREKNLSATRKDGTEFTAEISLGYCYNDGDMYVAAFINDLTQKKEADETIRRLSGDLDQKVKESTRSLHATVEQLSRQIKENERKDGELEKALAKEKELNELKSRFVSVASHEFRTPLSGVLASTYLLSKYTKTEEQPQRDKHIKRIIASVNMLNEVLGDFLSIDKIDQGNFKPNCTSFGIRDVIDDITQSIQHILKKGQTISYVHSGDDGNVFIDRSMLHHILINLLSNAIKYSPEGRPVILSVDQQSAVLSLSVKDQGIGIPAEEQQNLYKRFFRSSNVTHIEGTGLGLNIVKKYVEMLDGTIECKSELNKGTEFIITFSNQKEQNENNIDS